ncbi:MAG: hypothetical protein N3F62_03845 [Bacteroidia bacterium]|nr:hypothetical protein [Bacteroidia bacterium]
MFRLRLLHCVRNGEGEDCRSDSEARSSPTRTQHSRLKFLNDIFCRFETIVMRLFYKGRKCCGV